MTINEQTLKRKGRIYYHGSEFEDLNKDRANHSLFFMTVDWKYAIQYATLESEDVYNGYVYSFCLKEPINAFNPHSKIDLYQLCKSMGEPEIGWKAFNDILLNYDWFLFEKYEISRQCIFGKIKDLGYDGVVQTYENKFKSSDAGFHSIGIFDIDKVAMIDKATYEDFVHSKNEKTIKESELMDARIGNFATGRTFDTDNELFEFIYKNSHLTESDIKNYKNEILKNSRIISKNTAGFPIDEVEKIRNSDGNEAVKSIKIRKIYEKTTLDDNKQ